MPGPKKIEVAFFEKFIPEPNSGCWLWDHAVTTFGYGRLRNKGENLVAHRVSWEIHRGPIPKGLLVLHRCDVPACVNPDHLFLGTIKDNSMDMVSKGRMNFQKRPQDRKRGSVHHYAKIDEGTAKKIALAEGTFKSIALECGVTTRIVGHIKAGETWQHLDVDVVPTEGQKLAR